MSHAPKKKIAIIGAGWYGAHTARVLNKAGFNVTLLEAAEPFRHLSGMFGIRDHGGAHYPRSPKTRESCRKGAETFAALYPELIQPVQYAIYSLGTYDVDGKPSKVTAAEFKAVCKESGARREIVPSLWGYDNLICAFDMDEPCLVVGDRLRLAFKQYFQAENIAIKAHYPVKKIEKRAGKIWINAELEFDAVINATSFQDFLPTEPLPFGIDIKYQPCLALVYEDKAASTQPFSFIVMDGWFPCLMPYVEQVSAEYKKYIMTHGKWTIMGSYNTAQEARAIFGQIDEKFIIDKVKPLCETDMKRFWPKFSERFTYKGWLGNIVAKIKSNREFRSAVTFAHAGIIHIIPGKVTNVDDAAREVLALLNAENILQVNNYTYVKGGILDQSKTEITEKPVDVRNTCELQTYEELKKFETIDGMNWLYK